MSSILEHLKRAGIAGYVPVHFSITTGHLRSALLRKPVDAAGAPIPWYTFPAIDFLRAADFREYRVLEFGSGNSTIWWADRAASVLSMEHDEAWFQHTSQRLSQRRNVECVFRPDLDEHAHFPRGRTFDVVLVDGGDRYLCAQTALDVVAEHGVVLIDDSEIEWAPPSERPLVELFENEGFSRVDFHGYSAGVRRFRCTSLFFRNDAPLFKGLPRPVRRYSR